MRNGNNEDAKSFLKKQLRNHPTNSQAYKYLGNLYEKNRDLVKALENWKAYATKDEKSN